MKWNTNATSQLDVSNFIYCCLASISCLLLSIQSFLNVCIGEKNSTTLSISHKFIQPWKLMLVNRQRSQRLSEIHAGWMRDICQQFVCQKTRYNYSYYKA